MGQEGSKMDSDEETSSLEEETAAEAERTRKRAALSDLQLAPKEATELALRELEMMQQRKRQNRQNRDRPTNRKDDVDGHIINLAKNRNDSVEGHGKIPVRQMAKSMVHAASAKPKDVDKSKLGEVGLRNQAHSVDCTEVSTMVTDDTLSDQDASLDSSSRVARAQADVDIATENSKTDSRTKSPMLPSELRKHLLENGKSSEQPICLDSSDDESQGSMDRKPAAEVRENLKPMQNKGLVVNKDKVQRRGLVQNRVARGSFEGKSTSRRPKQKNTIRESEGSYVATSAALKSSKGVQSETSADAQRQVLAKNSEARRGSNELKLSTQQPRSNQSTTSNGGHCQRSLLQTVQQKKKFVQPAGTVEIVEIDGSSDEEGQSCSSAPSTKSKKAATVPLTESKHSASSSKLAHKPAAVIKNAGFLPANKKRATESVESREEDTRSIHSAAQRKKGGASCKTVPNVSVKPSQMEATQKQKQILEILSDESSVEDGMNFDDEEDACNQNSAQAADMVGDKGRNDSSTKTMEDSAADSVEETDDEDEDYDATASKDYNENLFNVWKKTKSRRRQSSSAPAKHSAIKKNEIPLAPIFAKKAPPPNSVPPTASLQCSQENEYPADPREKVCRAPTGAQHKEEFSSEAELNDFTTMDSRNPLAFRTKQHNEPYSLDEFEHLLHLAETSISYTTEEIEKGKLVRKSGNAKVRQYGRILPLGLDITFKKAMPGLNRNSTFVDLGHGIGNTCLQAAFTKGCKSIGIECCEDRNAVAVALKYEFEHISRIHRDNDVRNFKPGEVELLQGEIQNPLFRGRFVDSDYTFCNNFGGMFAGVHGDHSDKERQLDAYVAGHFALMKEGAVLVTLEPLIAFMGCKNLTKANETRSRLGKPNSVNASYYEYEEIDIGEAREIVSWSKGGSKKDILRCYKYTRTKQSSNGKAVFLCNNIKNCRKARDSSPIPAIEVDDKNRAYIRTCDCGFSDKLGRARR